MSSFQSMYSFASELKYSGVSSHVKFSNSIRSFTHKVLTKGKARVVSTVLICTKIIIRIAIFLFGQFFHKCSQDICSGPGSTEVATVIVIKSVRSFDLNWLEFLFFCVLQWQRELFCLGYSTIMVNRNGPGYFSFVNIILLFKRFNSSVFV